MQCGVKRYQKIRLVNLTRSASCRSLIYTANDKQTLRLRCLFDSIAWSVHTKKLYLCILIQKSNSIGVDMKSRFENNQIFA